MKAQYLGPKEGVFVPDEEATEILFDQMRRQVVPSQVPAGTVIQWDFTDYEPWHLVVDNGDTRVARGARAGARPRPARRRSRTGST